MPPGSENSIRIQLTQVPQCCDEFRKVSYCILQALLVKTKGMLSFSDPTAQMDGISKLLSVKGY